MFISIYLQFHVTPSSTSSHIAAAFDRNHHHDSGIHAMLVKLRHLLNVYHEMDNETHRYPWPSPPTVKFTTEEFQKLSNCRYLRLTKSNIESLHQLQKNIEEQSQYNGETNLSKNWFDFAWSSTNNREPNYKVTIFCGKQGRGFRQVYRDTDLWNSTSLLRFHEIKSVYILAITASLTLVEVQI